MSILLMEKLRLRERELKLERCRAGTRIQTRALYFKRVSQNLQAPSSALGAQQPASQCGLFEGRDPASLTSLCFLMFWAQLQVSVLVSSCLCPLSFSLPRHVACRILVPDQGSNPCPLHWDQGVLTTGAPGESLPFRFSSSLLSCTPTLGPASVGQWPLGVSGPEHSGPVTCPVEDSYQSGPWSYSVRPWTSPVLILSVPYPQHLESQGAVPTPCQGSRQGANSWLVQNAGIQVLGRFHRSGH